MSEQQQRSPDYHGFMEAMTAWAVVNAPRFALEASVVEGPIRRSLVDLRTGQPLFPDPEWPDQGRKVLAEIEAERGAAPRYHKDVSLSAAFGGEGEHITVTAWDEPTDENLDIRLTIEDAATLHDMLGEFLSDHAARDEAAPASEPPTGAPAIGTTWRHLDGTDFTIDHYEKTSHYWKAIADDGDWIMVNLDGTIRHPGWSQVVPEPEPDRPTFAIAVREGPNVRFVEFALDADGRLVLKDGDR